MNPSVVAAHKRIGLLQRFNKWQGKAMEKMQKSMDKMVSKIKSLEKKVSGSSSKKKKSKAPHSQGGRRGNSQRRRKSSKTRRSNSISELDRAEGRVDLEEPLFENPGFEYDSTQYQDFSQTTGLPTTASSKHSSSKAKEATHTFDEEEEEEEPQARSSEPNPVEWSAPDGRLPSPDHDLASQFFGGH
ncbi:unnamed protein product [Microthlaspi erraticum]|uniref:Uncharacterized protein n=1 Tax=Microthlaspi erraticum TaxID=1685480 RepID=A0A6D2I8J6_9BRAS|nr:unnamed protein product [Microthlaspi erraticum]